MTTVIKFMKKPNMAQVISHKNQALISSKTQQKKKIQKIDFGITKMCTEIINPKTKKIHTSMQTTIVYMTLI